MTATRLILASGSPRRAELLRLAGYEFVVMVSGFDEASHESRAASVDALALELATHKAREVADRLGSGVVIGADTLAELDGEAIGKPADRTEAEKILRALLARTHRTITAVCVIDAANGGVETIVDAAEVEMGSIEEGELAAYLDSKAWRGKAGGYNLDEMRGRWPIEVRGDPTTVIGLPMRRLVPLLHGFDAAWPRSAPSDA